MQAQDPLSLLSDIPAAWAKAALAGRREQLEPIVEAEREGGGWSALRALRCAHLWLAAGLAGLGDDLVLEADQLAPQANLIPDWWGLWPAAGASELVSEQGTHHPEQVQAQQLAALYVQLRHEPPQRLLELWRAAVQACPARLDEPALQLLLGGVIHARARLESSLELRLAEIVGEELVAREPALAYRLFEPLCERLPAWGYARLKAADLALQRGELERCHGHLAAASDEQRQLPWLHDIAARLALANSDVEGALAAWKRAIAAASQQAELVELFRQRAREAGRGPGVLQARILVNRGEVAAAIELLEVLLVQDPQWQPLRSLLEQVRAGQTSAPLSRAGEVLQPPADDPGRLERKLRLLAQRAGLSWPAESAATNLQDDAMAVEQSGTETPTAAGFERFLQVALGRLALLG